MSWPHAVIWGVVLCVGLPSAFRNVTALALSASWLAGELTWMATGNNLPLSVYFMADIAVIAVIYAKSIRRVGVKSYPSWDHLKGFVSDLTICDRIIVAIFLLGAWPAYVFNLDAYNRWWLLWYLTVAQFLFAGLETAFSLWRSKSRLPRPPNNILLFAPAYSRSAHRRLGAEPIFSASSALCLPAENVGDV